ncbi:MAG: type II toxin-antitoxin system Phd/YefM family antitoxin [Acidimicrobiales bacterium]
MEVGVRELKRHLSEYLERAANGERITVGVIGVSAPKWPTVRLLTWVRCRRREGPCGTR